MSETKINRVEIWGEAVDCLTHCNELLSVLLNNSQDKDERMAIVKITTIMVNIMMYAAICREEARG